MGTTRSDAKAPVLQAMSVEPVVIVVFDADGLRNAMAHVRPSVVVHQLTALPPGLDPSKMREALVRNDPAYASGRREETLQLLVQQRVRRYGERAARDRLSWDCACHRRLAPQISHLWTEHCSAGISERAYALWVLASALFLGHSIVIGDTVFMVTAREHGRPGDHPGPRAAIP